MDFKSYFQDELAYLRDAGDEFSRLNPKLAKYLSSSSTDPDIVRLMEGFAFLTARLRMTLDDGLPEVTQSVLRMVWPNFVRPFPPLTLMKACDEEVFICFYSYHGYISWPFNFLCEGGGSNV